MGTPYKLMDHQLLLCVPWNEHSHRRVHGNAIVICIFTLWDTISSIL